MMAMIRIARTGLAKKVARMKMAASLARLAAKKVTGSVIFTSSCGTKMASRS